eukprot:scpid106996/ scgid15225/ 
MFVREEVKGHEWHDLNALVLQVLKKRARAAATSFVPKRTLQHLVDFRLKDSKYSEKLSDFSRFRRICFGECLATTRYFVLHVVEAWMHSLWHMDIHRFYIHIIELRTWRESTHKAAPCANGTGQSHPRLWTSKLLRFTIVHRMPGIVLVGTKQARRCKQHSDTTMQSGTR